MRLALILATNNSPGENYFMPLGLGYLRSYLNRKLPQMEVEIHQDIDALLQSKPDCAGVSGSTFDFGIAKRYIARIQEELGIPVLLGGVHVTLLPESLPKGVTGCIGEGEETLTELLGIFLEYHSFNSEQLAKVNGIAYWDVNGHLVRTAARELIAPLDRLPLPDRDALGIKPFENDTLYMFTSRGCPYKCKFCVSRVHWHKYREFTADYVLQEIDHLVGRYGVKTISFFDDLFIANRKRLREIAEGFSERQYPVETTCSIRANLVDDELCYLLKRLNTREVMFGAESFSEPVLKVLKGGNVTAAQNQYALEVLHKHGIKTNVSMIFGSPEETREDMVTSWKALFDNLRSRKINKVGWGLLIPYPGSGYWDEAVQRGLCSVNMDWEVFRCQRNLLLNDHMTKEECDQVIDEWETKCYLVNLRFRDEPIPRYLSRGAVFAKKENLIRSISERAIKDESDIFVAQDYKQFLKEVADHENKLILFQGWEASSGQDYRWIGKDATFFIHSAGDEANLLNLVFYVPDIGYYPDNRLSVTLEIENLQRNLMVLSSGEHSVTIPLPSRNAKGFLNGRIASSEDFCPAKVMDSSDKRNLSIVVSRFELAKDESLNIVSVFKLPKN